MVYPYIRGKVKTGSARPREGWGRLPSVFEKPEKGGGTISNEIGLLQKFGFFILKLSHKVF
jgi:hypothetical protein